MTMLIGTRRALLSPIQVSGWLHNGTWAQVGSDWVNTPTLGSELFANTGFDADTNWGKGSGWTIGAGVASKAPGTSATISQSTLTTHVWYQVQWTITSFVAGAFSAFIGAAVNLTRAATGTFIDTGRAASTGGGVRAVGTTAEGAIDNVSGKALTLNQLFIVKTGSVATAKPTLVLGACSGVVAKLNSIASPADCIIGYHDGANAVMLKLVTGVYTQLISAAVTYVAGAIIELRNPSGNTWQLWYNGVQRGTDQTISDASIISNTLAGGFSTYSGNTLAELTVT